MSESALPEGSPERTGFPRLRPARLFAALVAGLVAGALLAGASTDVLDPTVTVATSVGSLWLNGLTMTVVPLVVGLLIVSVADASNAAGTGTIARRAMIWFAVLLVASGAVALLTTLLLLDLWPANTSGLIAPGAAEVVLPDKASDWISGIIPANPIKAAADMAMLPLVVFALLFGLAATRIAEPLRQIIVTFFTAVVEAMLVIVHWVLWLAPIGVFALALVVGVRMGAGAFGALFHYIVIVAVACLASSALSIALAWVFGGLSPAAFMRAALPAQTVAVGTQSSLASLPAMIKVSPGLGVSPEASGIILPLAVSIFRAASVAANVAVAFYLAHFHGLSLGPAEIVAGLAAAVALSLAAVGLPAQVNFFATIAPVCIAMGVPVVLLPLLLAVESVPDIFRTLCNVTADLAVTRLAGREKQLA